MNRYMIAGAAALLTMGASACTPRQIAIAKRAAAHHAPARRAPSTACVGDVIVVTGDEPVGCDLRPPQRLNVLGITAERCLDMGGTPEADPDAAADGLVDCVSVDY